MNTMNIINTSVKGKNHYFKSIYSLGSIVALIFIIGSVSTYVAMQNIKIELSEKITYEHSVSLSNMLVQFRTLYTSEVVTPAKNHGMIISHNYQEIQDAIPLPATLSIKLANAINETNGGFARLYSDYPFSWRKDGGTKDDFGKEAIEIFRTSDEITEFYRIEKFMGTPSLRYAVPDRMRSSCIGCHNNHPESPKKNWKEGDIRGVLEVVVPMKSGLTIIGKGLQEVWLIMGSLGFISLFLLWLANKKSRQLAIQITQSEAALKQEMKDRLRTQKEKDKIESIASKLIESEEKMRSIVETAAEGIVTIKSDRGTISTFNSAAEKIFGYTTKELIGVSFSQLIPNSIELADYILRGIQREKDVIYETVGLKNDGSEFPMSTSISELFINDQKSYTIIIRDLTAQKSLESKLLQSQKLESIGQLSAGIAHEINTPIQFIGDNLVFIEDSILDLNTLLYQYQKLASDNEDKTNESWLTNQSKIKKIEEDIDLDFIQEEIPGALHASKQGVERVSRIIRAMKEFSHPGTDNMELTDINNAIENTIVIAQNEWKYMADLKTELDPDLPHVPCYLGEFNQVIINLIVNASHAISDSLANKNKHKGLINVKTFSEESEIIIEIQDDGTGIPESQLNKIFDPFFTTKEVGKGTGQGLSIAHRVITERHKGTLEVESTLGRGTIFIIRLPLHSN